jgi:hypothetical protein
MAISVGQSFHYSPAPAEASLYINFVVIFVGAAQSWLSELTERTKRLKLGGGFEEGADLCVKMSFPSESEVKVPI